ncbi:MAG: hypothetical protein F4073_06835 [Rhodobacteraceae bacterium]|nr:DUF6088 family protein [Gammaproteobacteria bacterium]MCY3725832.1 DUF6088 family protein [Paracoccaceae bacterium]MDE2739842.1 DUF6088 family protein [Paracoccaceae bacterium]MDE2759735.1 DUF6088 family protein [Paracoccaceae bacterium]MDE2916692.1 DUF6088 family protein [Paracoccaceae bacterium]
MIISKTIQLKINQIPKGQPFTTFELMPCGSRGAIDKVLSRLTQEGKIIRLSRGIFVRPKKNSYIGTVLPEITEIIQKKAQNNGERIQVHGAEAARRLGLSTQVPLIPVYYTNASSRTYRIVNLTVKMIHTSNPRLLQFSGEPSGLAISALWYIGRKKVTTEMVAMIKSKIGSKEFNKLRSANLPLWMAGLIESSA